MRICRPTTGGPAVVASSSSLSPQRPIMHIGTSVMA
jgi:hypothetical protein